VTFSLNSAQAQSSSAHFFKPPLCSFALLQTCTSALLPSYTFMLVCCFLYSALETVLPNHRVRALHTMPHFSLLSHFRTFGSCSLANCSVTFVQPASDISGSCSVSPVDKSIDVSSHHAKSGCLLLGPWRRRCTRNRLPSCRYSRE
jgi:hypothetical protein